MSEARETRKRKLIAFRVTDQDYAQIERMALSVGEDANNWCRNIIVAEARDGYGLMKAEQLLYEEVARVRYLVGHGWGEHHQERRYSAPEVTFVERLPSRLITVNR